MTLDGVQISELDSDAYRRVVGLVAQDAHIFDSSLEENLRLAKREATQDELRGALAKVRLLNWAQRLPAGLATEVGGAWGTHVRWPASAPGNRPGAAGRLPDSAAG